MKRKYFVSLMLVFVLVFTCSLAAVAAEKKTDAEKKDEAKKESTEKVLIDINSASLEELEELPGIGPKTAQAIIDARPFDSVEALLDVKGIGEKKLEKIEGLVEAKAVKKGTKKDTKKSDEKSKK